MGNLSIKKTNEREDRYRRLLEATDEKTIAGALDIASKHYLADLEAKEDVAKNADDMSGVEVLEELSNPFIPIVREVETSVGRRD